MNFASIHKLPVVFICENNRYAISVPLEKQMAIKDVATRAASYGFPGYVINGMDVFPVVESTRDAIEHARSQGPVLLEMKVERYMPHTTDDDDRRYRPSGRSKKPAGVTPSDCCLPTSWRWVYSPPRLTRRYTGRPGRSWTCPPMLPKPLLTRTRPQSTTTSTPPEEVTLAVLSVVEAVREAMYEEMKRDPNVFIMGEDVGKHGGVFLATQGFVRGVRRGTGRGHPPCRGFHRWHRTGGVFQRTPAHRRDTVLRLYLAHGQPAHWRSSQGMLWDQRGRIGAPGSTHSLWRRRSWGALPLPERGSLFLSYPGP